MRALRLPWRDQGSRNQGSGIRSGTGRGGGGGGGGGDESRGGAGGGGARAPGCRLPAVPAGSAPPAAASIVCGPALPRVGAPPQPFASRFLAALLDPGNCRRDCDPGPERWSGGCLNSCPGPTPQPLLGLFFSTRLSETEPPDPEGWPCSIL